MSLTAGLCCCTSRGEARDKTWLPPGVEPRGLEPLTNPLLAKCWSDRRRPVFTLADPRWGMSVSGGPLGSCCKLLLQVRVGRILRAAVTRPEEP